MAGPPRKRFYTDAELRYLPIEFSLEEYTKDQLSRIWGVSPSYAADIKRHPEWTVQRIGSPHEGEPVLCAEYVRKLRAYQEAGS